MIIQNGTMQAVEMSGGGFDGSGNPIGVTRVLGDPIPVNISGNRRFDNTTSRGSSFTSATYEVLCEDTCFSATEIELTDNRGHKIGTFRVKDNQYLELMDAIKIIAEKYE